MKLIYLHQYFLFPEDSGGTRSYDLAKSFVKQGFEVEVITSSGFIKSVEFYDQWTLIKREGIKIHVLKLDYSNSMSYVQRILVFIKFLWFSTIKALAIKADIVLATSTPLTIGIPALIKKWLHKTPFVFETRDVWPEVVVAIGAINNNVVQNLLYYLEKTIYKNSSAIVSLSSDMKQSIVSRYPNICKNKPVIVIENISEIERFSNVSDTVNLKEIIGFQPRFTVLYAGTFGRVNGIEYVIDLAKKTLELDASIVYILIGDGAMKESVTKKAKLLNVLNKNVFIFDAINKQDLPSWYHAVNMGSSFVISIKELWANSANKFFDTLAASRSILVNYPGWQSKIIKEFNLGYVMPTKVTQESAEKFVEYSRNEQLHRNQRINALNKAILSYSLEVATKKYINLFKTISEN
ncbi:glycosyltransferase family 4 protein [Nonlabens agnitus]|uniref:Glycosyltransferase WbuB n=1 Tax=Nonlabens agnitus TaxID=870484 RepID=A0A2S9WTW9_9FLAO|nr:glycosyltransferase family 4 protein [Nonlabens agnitus]PRP66920.1 hypothetical protein BST86_07320 [Nonlabens agnitus]